MYVYTCTRAQIGIHTHTDYVQLNTCLSIEHFQSFALVTHLEREGASFPLGREGSKVNWKQGAVITLSSVSPNQPGIGKVAH